MPTVKKLPKDQAEGYVCKACAAEGNAAPQPADHFYLISVPEYKKGAHWRKYKDNKQRSVLCKRHHNMAEAERERKRLDPTLPTYDPDYHERVKANKRRYVTKKLTPGSTDYDAALHERQKESKRQYAADRRKPPTAH